MQPARHIPRYTYQDYLLWEGDWEMIDGVPYAMSPSPRREHQALAGEIFANIKNELAKNKSTCSDCSVFYEFDWIVDNITVFRPDISIVCYDTGDFISTPPVLIIEILSPSSAYHDRMVKQEKYEQNGVRYYILADPNTSTYTVYQLIDGKYQEYNLNTFTIHDGCTLTIDVAKALEEVK